MEGQIIKIISNLYTVSSEDKVFECRSRGKFRNEGITPVVGDYVRFNEKECYILEILPRKNALIRPLVSNIDQGLIVTSVKHPDFSSNLLDKLIAILEYHNIEPVLCFSKWDLLSAEETREMELICNYYKKIGYSVVKNTELDRIKQLLEGKTTVFTGQTGAGKSSLMNHLDSNLNLETGEISEALGRGKHTTRHTELIEMYGGKVLDTPGFSSVDLKDLTKEEIRDTFIEFQQYPCPFRDCMHQFEKECEVKKNVENGNILSTRYENYIKFLNPKKW
ncbi:MAG: ribosome small subunit-dependent GTPase A [Bacilli bacterium]|nr:ribosome small subunit-dependent GTPase A [Bacilli bacterium]